MKPTLQLLFGLTFLIGFSCSTEDDLNTKETLFFWNQTKCVDSWNTGENDSNTETEDAVIEYLKNENVAVISLNFDTNSPLETTCESCGCGTGQRIIVEVHAIDTSKMKALEFYQ